jgi:hypothetical protein
LHNLSRRPTVRQSGGFSTWKSGLDLKAYAEQAGKVYTTLSTKVKAWRVLSVTDVSNDDLRDRWYQLAEIHAAPSWLWAALVQAMVADGVGVRHEARVPRHRCRLPNALRSAPAPAGAACGSHETRPGCRCGVSA